MVNDYVGKSDSGGKTFKGEGNWVTDEKKNKKGFWSRKFVEFCERTDLHGYKYIVMNELNIAERACWALFVAISIACAASFVSMAYNWYAKNPVLTVIETTQAAVWDVPFPAVTICDLNIVSRKAARALTHNLTLPMNVTSEYIFEILRLVPLLHSILLASAEQKKKLSELQTIIDMNNISIETLFRRVSPAASCNNILRSCKWKNTFYRCDQLFQQVFTMTSLCCTFNYLAVDSNFQTTENDFLHSNTPRRVASCGYQTALTVLINTDVEDYYSTSIASQGVLVYVDNAYNMPTMNSPVRMVNPSTEVLIALTPESTYSTYDVKDFSPEQRQCYYKNEVYYYGSESVKAFLHYHNVLWSNTKPISAHLSLDSQKLLVHNLTINLGKFHHYSFHNCLIFQFAMAIKHYCQCIPFFIPSKEYHRSCDFNDINCLELFLTPSNTDYVEDSFNINFTCLPECEHYDYPFEVALGTRWDNTHINGFPYNNDVNIVNCSTLNVFFNDLVSTRYRRDVCLNWQNILAIFGGLLGLMLGFTLISGLDIILFFVLRIMYDGAKTIFADKPNAGNKIHVEVINNNNLLF